MTKMFPHPVTTVRVIEERNSNKSSSSACVAAGSCLPSAGFRWDASGITHTNTHTRTKKFRAKPAFQTRLSNPPQISAMVERNGSKMGLKVHEERHTLISAIFRRAIEGKT